MRVRARYLFLNFIKTNLRLGLCLFKPKMARPIKNLFIWFAARIEHRNMPRPEKPALDTFCAHAGDEYL